MRRVEISQHPDDDERRRLVGFVEEVEAATGSRPLSDHLWLDLLAGGADGFVAVTAHELADGSPVAIGMAQVSAANDGCVLEVFTRPGAPDAEAITVDLADTAVDAARAAGASRLTWWVDDATDAIVELAAQHGLAPERALHEMRRPLPHPHRSSVTTRAFVPGTDDDPWLAVNNRAFAQHGEQGGWNRATLALRMSEPWFDAEGFRIHEIDGEVVAFCWTKIHPGTDPLLGEIYVIAVDPAHHGHGLGRELTLAGLDSLADRGVAVASLYVDAGNTAAVRVYERLGFAVRRTRSAFSGRLVNP